MNNIDLQAKQIARQYVISTVLFCAALASPAGLFFAYFYGISDSKTWMYLFLTAAFGGGAVGVLAVIINSKRFIKPIGIMADFLKSIADKDLTVTLVQYNFGPMDLMKKAFERMNKAMNNFFTKLMKSTTEINHSVIELRSEFEGKYHSSNEISAAILQVAKGNEDQTIAVLRIMEENSEIGERTKEIDDYIEKILIEINDLEKLAQNGASGLDRQFERVELNYNTMNDMNEEINELVTLSKEINEIMNVINNIAGQTNLLALNASIEAARSGEQGKGFDVVAQQVKTLAEQSATAAREINILIKDIQSSTGQVLGEMTKAKDAVSDQKTAVVNNRQIISEVADNFNLINNGINILEKGIFNISNSITNVNSASENVSAVTEETTAGSEEVSAIIEEQNRYMNSINHIYQEMEKTALKLSENSSQFRLK